MMYIYNKAGPCSCSNGVSISAQTALDDFDMSPSGFLLLIAPLYHKAVVFDPSGVIVGQFVSLLYLLRSQFPLA